MVTRVVVARGWVLWILLVHGLLGPGVGSGAVLDLARLGAVTQSGDAAVGREASRAVDGSGATFSATREGTNAFWEIELERVYALDRLELVMPADPAYAGAGDGLTVRVFDLRDRVVFQAAVTDSGAGGAWSIDLPAGLEGRVIRVGLEGGQPNGNGRHQVVLAEVRLWGDHSPAVGPLRLREVAVATQTSDGSASTVAGRALDGDVSTYSETAGEADGGWLLTLDRLRWVHRVEVVNRTGAAAARLGGLTLRLLDEHSNTVARAVLEDPGAGRRWGTTFPAGTRARQIRIGLEDGRTNGAGDYRVALAEVNVLTGENLALGREAYAVRFLDSQAAARVANDGDYTTEFKSTDKTVDAYWEVDLGEERAVSSVRVIAATGFTARLARGTVRLFDGGHRSVYARRLQGSVPTFDVEVAGPRRARYVRVGFENKERSDPAGGIEWYLGLKEVEVYGQPADGIGLLEFGASTNGIEGGGTATLFWREAGLDRLELWPGFGSVGAWTGLDGVGSVGVAPRETTEYWLVGTGRDGVVTRAVTVAVDGGELPVQISEFVANNRFSWEDGRGEAPDWIEVHNPNGKAVDLEGYGLSDDPGRPRKWVFPSVLVPPHGFLVVFASGRSEPFDAGGHLHATFQLDQGGESVVLTAPDGVTVVDAVEGFPPQREDLAYGRAMGGGWAFLEPTPGRWNWSTSYAGWLRPPEFGVARGFKTNAFTLALSDPNEGSALFYSMDGREPTTRYQGPLAVGASAVVRATVRRSGYKEPRVQTHSYLFPERLLTAGNMNQALTQDPGYGPRILRSMVELPILSIAVPNLPDDYVEREASVEVFLPGGEDPVQANAGFYRFGGAWTTFAKKNYRLKFRAEYGERKLRVPLFRGFDRGILAQGAFDELDLGGGSHDMVERGFYLGSRFAEDTMLDMGSLNPHGRFAHVFINGNYWGQYHVRERLNDAFLADYLGGEREGYVNVRGNDNVGSSFILGTPEPPRREAWERVLAARGSYRDVRADVDVPHLIDFMLMWGYGDAEPEYRAAGPVVSGSGFKFWLGDADGYLRTSALNKDPGANPGPGGIFGALVAEGDPDFRMLVADRVQRHCFGGGALTPARALARLDERMLEITNSLVAECARWGYRTPANWQTAAQGIRTGLFPDRARNLVNGLRAQGLFPAVDAPTLSHEGGSVTNGFELVLGGSGEGVYYTLDGSDPRMPGGEISPGARRVDLGVNVLVAAGSVWRYWDRGSLPGAQWAQPGFADGSWSSGRAQLGYGDGGEATVLGYGSDASDKYRAYYFRLAFGVADPAGVSDLVLELLRDDGAVVYLNGREVVRDNMPAGLIEHTTWASSAVGGAEESTFYRFPLSATNLVAGTNWLAVEVHQATANSTDLSFDLALVGGAVASDPTLVLRSNTVLRARSWAGGVWSALVEARYVVGEPVVYRGEGVEVTEVHYNPDGSDDYELIELGNTGDQLLDLSGARLEGAVEFLFPAGTYLAPGAFLLVVESIPAFAARYQDPASPYYYPGLRVAGEWSGRLDDGGERVVLLTRDRVEGVAVRYRADGSWPQRADGRGSSLELRELGGGPVDPGERARWLSWGGAWRSSALYHGSPGRWAGACR